MAQGTGDVTQLLLGLRHGDRGAEGRLLEVVYAELHRLAAALMRRERPITPCNRPRSSTKPTSA